MNLTESLHTLRKRWILTSLLLLLVLAATAGAALKLPKSYQSSSSVAFLASKAVSKNYSNNPYLAFDSSLDAAADVVGRRMMDPQIVSALAAQGYSSPYQVEDATNSPAPVLIITVTDHNKTAVERTLRGVTNAIGTQLAVMQSGIAPGNQIKVTVLSISQNPTPLSSKTARPIVGVLVLGLVLAIGIPLMVEGISARRRNGNKPTSTLSRETVADVLPSYRRPSARTRYGDVSVGSRDRNGRSS